MITDNEFKRIVLYVKNNYGIDLSQKRVLVGGRLENYLVRNGYASYDDYMAKVEANPKGTEATDLINVLTTNHTYFMRESTHFDYMRRVVLPWAKTKAGKDRDLRIWSAASSTGEEPYTLAMLLMDYFGLEHKTWDTKVLATDVSTRVLEHATRGIYLKEEIGPLPPKWKQRFFKRINEEEYQVKDELKKEVIFRQFNLMNPFPFRKQFHIVFLRNVMIYFPDDTKYQVIQKIYDHMEPGGYLFIGTTESLNRGKTQFQYIEPSIYRKQGN
ncbi:MAG: protein-glutamate O-methyltransferase CheR [Lachnospiraceae bacterium]|nr:protein-glutamate O-methyltransferase CheR [Lachnospiraceae bacterium]